MNRKLFIIQLVTIILLALSAIIINFLTNDKNVNDWLLEKGFGTKTYIVILFGVTGLLLILEYFKSRTQPLNKTIKGFILGFVLCLILISPIFYFLCQPDNSDSNKSNTNKNTNKSNTNSNPTPTASSSPTPLIPQNPTDNELRKTKSDLTVEVQETELKDSVFTITLLLTSKDVDKRVYSHQDSVRITADNGGYIYPLFLARGDSRKVYDFDKNLIANDPLEVKCIFEKIPNTIQNINTFEIKFKVGGISETFQFKDLKANINYRRK